MGHAMKPMTRMVAAAMFCLIVAACGSSPPVHYYALEPMDIQYDQDPATAPILGLGPLRTPEYLSRSQMVMRSVNGEMIVDDFHRWAEPIDQSIHRILAANVDGLMTGVAVIAFPYNAAFDLDYQLIGRVEQFDADDSGRAELAIQWSVVDATSDIVVPPRRVRYESGGNSSGDAGSMARAMNDCLAQFSRDVAREMEQVIDTAVP